MSTVLDEHPRLAEVPARLGERLAHLGTTLLRLRWSTPAAVVSGGGWFEDVVARSAVFASAVQRRWEELERCRGELVTIWPGVSLVPMHDRCRRRPGRDGHRRELLAALVLGPAVAQTEQLHRICDEAALDVEATQRRLRSASLMSQAEASRLAQTLGWMHEDALEIDRRRSDIHGMSANLAETYEELSLLYKFSSSITLNQQPESFVHEACRELQQVGSLRWIGIQLIDGDPRLGPLAGGVYFAGDLSADAGLMQRAGRMLMERYATVSQPVVVDEVGELGIAGLDELTRSVLVVPLRDENARLLGLLLGGDKLDGTTINTVDLKLCGSLGSSLSIFLRNMMLYEDMQAMFLGTLHALTSAIDAKDTYTHGHSERVALLSRALAEAAGLSEHTCERVYIAGLVHDVGKIGVSEQVLCKPGKLTNEEFELIKAHPRIGARILQDIRQMQDLMPGVLHHHERWDGRGYPDGLAGDAIPLFGRLIGLADAFDAMSSNRTYRKAMDLDTVLGEVERCAGTQFDPELAPVFMQLDFQPFFELIERHRVREDRLGTAFTMKEAS
ncbi:MAG: HD-GYP domain-containing protein [Phycisphaeraceae bacterium]